MLMEYSGFALSAPLPCGRAAARANLLTDVGRNDKGAADIGDFQMIAVVRTGRHPVCRAANLRRRDGAQPPGLKSRGARASSRPLSGARARRTANVRKRAPGRP